MKLSALLNIKRNSITSIVGAGGKTTLMFYLADEHRQESKVLVTTTTKIYVPENEQYDHLMLDEDSHNEIFKGFKGFKKPRKSMKFIDSKIGSKINSSENNQCEMNNGIYVYGGEINEDNKLTSIDDKNLGKLAKEFDFTFIEADGSKKRSLKGWREDEPLVSEYTTNTIGIIDGQGLGLEINEENIHRLDKFLGKHHGKVNEEDFLEVIFNPKGLFNHSRGSRTLFVNRVDDEEIQESISKLVSEIINKNMAEKLLDKIVVGSLINIKFKIIDFEK